MIEFISHAAMLGALMLAFGLMIYQLCVNIADGADAPEESEDERW